MLAIISDLHLTDKTSGEIISDSAFRLFRNRLSDMAYDASWHCDAEGAEPYYKPIERMDIILLGDILDMIRSEKWIGQPDDNMPWSKKKTDAFYTLADNIVDDILLKNASSFEILKDIHQKGIRIPLTMDVASRATQEKEKVKYAATGDHFVTVHIHYMIGNHDWFFCIDDRRMDKTRKKVVEKLGLANDPGKPFPHARKDNTEILWVQDEHKVFAEHGDEYDPTNYQKPHRDDSSIGDAVVIKLLNAIPDRIEHYLQPSADKLDPDELKAFIKALHEIDNLRPYTLAADWIDYKRKESKLPAAIINPAISLALREVIAEFRQCPLVAKNKQLSIILWFVKLMFGRGFNIAHLGYILKVLHKTKDTPESYRKYALEMANKQDKDFFVMGHTHYAEAVPLYNYDEGKRSKIYLNTGTWRSVHFKPLQGDGFISYKTMTIAGFYKPNERKGRPFEFWTGYLAI